MKGRAVLFLAMFLSGGLRGQPTNSGPLAAAHTERMILEQKHFVECLAYVYSPPLWISYRGSLYFAPKTEAVWQQIEGLKAARAKYVALTNREVRHQIAAEVIAESGLDNKWQEKLLLPYSDTQQNLTPTLNRPFRIVSDYKLVQSLPEGDALIEGAGGRYIVMDFGTDSARNARTNLYLIKEGERALSTAPGEYQRLEAFSSVALSKEETAVLNRVVTAFQHKAASLDRELTGFKAREEFEESKARATDSNPYLQYLVARCYLEGKGTPQDQKLGMEWMNKAAGNGSGDAKTYLQAQGVTSH